MTKTVKLDWHRAFFTGELTAKIEIKGRDRALRITGQRCQSRESRKYHFYDYVGNETAHFEEFNSTSAAQLFAEDYVTALGA